jgi:EmrB/QacA subfamily drug resistance transporter
MNSRAGTLVVLCLAAFVINLDTTIVNVALPSLVRRLHASTTDLEWIVDSYNLAFAALVLAAGSLGDRFGRRGMLVAGLAVFGAASLAGAAATDTAQLTTARAVMGVGAAMIFPATLSIIANVFPERAARAKAIGAWGATTGVGIALGPIAGGWLLQRYWWGSIFLFMAPIAAVTAALVVLAVPSSRDLSAPRLDLPGLVLSTLGMGALVLTVIEAPGHGWASPRTAAGFAAAAALLVALVLVERRRRQPMLDVALFRNLRFSAASGTVTVAFFALMGFIFLVAAYFQFVKGYGPFGTGVRMLPVALCVGLSSVAGAQLAVRIGNKAVVAGGLLLLASAFLWISAAASADTGYGQIAAQMVVLGTGIGLTQAPATEAIMGALRPQQAGVGSAVNDATRLLGGTLGVAVIGSVSASVYTAHLADLAPAGLPADAATAAQGSVGGALQAAARLAAGGAGDLASGLHGAAIDAFLSSFRVGCLVAGGVALAGAVLALLALPARPAAPSTVDTVVRERDPQYR